MTSSPHDFWSPWIKEPPRFRPFYMLPGTRVGTYVIHEAIGQGGGQVAYLAETSDGRQVVLKMSLYPAGPKASAAHQMHERFLRQVGLLLHLRNVPGVAQVFAHDMYPDASEDGYAYMVQEWVKGSINILKWFQAEPRPLKGVVFAWMLLGNACGEMHRRGICHRDLKPENILMEPVGLGAPKIVDFDSAFSVGGSPLTSEGAARWPGTRRYYSPEIAKAILHEWSGEEMPQPFQYQPPSDTWALGVILYEVLTGEYPFEESDDSDVLYDSIIHDVPDRPRALNPQVPFGLDKVVMRLLHKDPAKRPEGDELVAELEALFQTKDDWERPFQTPARNRHGSDTSRTEPVTRTPTPRLGYRGGFRDSTACQPAPMAIVLAEPRPLVVRGPRALLRLVPAPAALVPVPQPARAADPAPRQRPLPRRLLFPLAAALALAFAGPFLGKGSMLLGRAKVAVIAAGSALLSACPSLTGKVRTDDRAWLTTKCPPDALKAARDLALVDSRTGADLEDGPNVIWHEDGSGTEVRDGPVEVSAVLQTPGKGTDVRLFGELRTGSDGASIHLNKARRFPDGPEFPICAIVYVRGSHDSPGIPKRETGPFPPPSEIHPGYMLVDTFAALMIEVAE